MSTKESKSQARNRNKRAKELLYQLFAEAAQGPLDAQLDDGAQRVLNKALGPLKNDPPGASQGAEVAATISALTVAEGELFDLNSRIDGDRTVGDWFCANVLRVRNIPSTKGPLQSSSFRGGYKSDQVRSDAVRMFADWYSEKDRALSEVKDFLNSLVNEFSARATELPTLPGLNADRFTFARFKSFSESLLSEGSGGAFQQYLLAGILDNEIANYSSGMRVATKNVGANDAATSSGGDIEVRHSQALLAAYEVTANSWETKIDQLEAAAAAGLNTVNIVAPDVHRFDGSYIEETIRPVSNRLGMDIAILDLQGFMDTLSSRLTRHARSRAVTYLDNCLRTWHRREPELIQRVISTLNSHELTLVESNVSHDSQMHAESPSIDPGSLELMNILGIDNPNDLSSALRLLADRWDASASTTIR